MSRSAKSSGEEAVCRSSNTNVRKGSSSAPVSLHFMHCAKEKLSRMRCWLKCPVCGTLVLVGFTQKCVGKNTSKILELNCLLWDIHQFNWFMSTLLS